jgi:hypothetical protein
MKKNPLFYAKTNANAMKIYHEKKKLVLTILAAVAFVFMYAISVDHSTHAGKQLDTASAGLALVIAGFPKNSAEEQDDEYLARYIKHLNDEIKVAKENKEVKDELVALKAVLKKLTSEEDGKGIVELLKAEVSNTNKRLEGILEKQKESQVKDITDQLKAWAEENKSSIASFKGGEIKGLKPFTVKLNSPMTPSNTYNSSNYLPIPEFQAGATEIVRVQPTFWDYITKGRTSAANYVWVNKKNPEGAAGFIAPGVAKPGVSLELATETSVAKKIAVSSKCATELLDDIPGMASYIQQEMAYQLRAELNSKLMTGTASSTVPAGIQTLSVAYSLSGVETSDPNNYDAIRAAVAQLRSGNLMGTVTVFVNPVDAANMELSKAVSQGQYLVVNGEKIAATIVEDNNIAVGYFQAAILDYYKILIYQDFTVSFGWENDDFTKNLVTSIAEMRIHQFSSENHTGFAIYDTFANVKAAIAAV